MSCYHPLKAFVLGLKENGKKQIKVCSFDVDHLTRRFGSDKWVSMREPVPSDGTYQRIGLECCTEFVEIPCGKCIGCRLEYSRQWANRCMLELQYHDQAWFVTLTYDEDHVPKSCYVVDDETGEAQESLTLCKRDFQLFMKRLRKRFDNDQIRFFASGEYGDKGCRPHYHVILFGLHLSDVVPSGKSIEGFQYFESAALNRCWSAPPRDRPDAPSSRIGIVKCAPVTWETCAYTARYVVKKASGQMAQFYSDFNIEPEFSLMSLKPGIARQYYDDHKDYFWQYDEINISTDQGGRKFKPPRYYSRLYDLDDPEASAEVKAQRQKMAAALLEAKLAQTGLNREELLAVEEEAFLNKVKKLKRSSC